MSRFIRIASFFAVIAAGALLAPGCGPSSDSCPTNSAQIAKAPGSCGVVAPGGTVRVHVGVCQECNESSPTCSVDVQGSGILLDTIVEACQEPGSCTASKSCSPTVTCQFKAPSAAGDYNLEAASTTVSLPGITVAADGAASVDCI